MGGRGVAVGLLVLLATVSVVAVAPRPAAAAGPTFSDISWYPRVPARNENVTVYANISGTVTSAMVQWCVIPPFTCIPYAMADPNADGRWNTTASITVSPNHHYTGADFNISATDSLGVTRYANFSYVQFGDAIQVNATLNTTSTTPGGHVSVSGTAHYEYQNDTGWHTNYTTPAWNSSVRVRIVETGDTVMSKTDGSGRYTATFVAPAAIGSYTVNVSVTNRTLAGSRARSLAVSNVPTPDLAIVQGSLAVSRPSVRAGDNVTLSFTIENRGSGNATDFLVRLLISDSTSTEIFRHDFTLALLAPAGTHSFVVSWTAEQGSMTVNVTIDPVERLTELSRANNYATLAFVVGAAPPPPDGLSITLIAGLTILVLGSAAAAVVLVLRRRRARPEGPR